MKVSSLNIRNTVQIKHTLPAHCSETHFIENYVGFAVSAVVSKNEYHRIFLIEFEHIDVTITIEEKFLGDEESSISVRYTKENNTTVEIYKDECFLYDFENEIYFPKDEVIAAINNKLKKDYDFVVFPDIDYNSICNF